MKIYTKKGDDGTTGLLYGGRVPKDDVRTNVYGTLDETVSALGLARAGGLTPRVEEIVIRVQREMFIVGAQLATSKANQSKLQEGVSKVTPDMALQAEREIDELLEEHPLPNEFILPGETMGSAGLDVARLYRPACGARGRGHGSPVAGSGSRDTSLSQPRLRSAVCPGSLSRSRTGKRAAPSHRR